MNTRKYPVGIQTFSEIIRGGYVYVDKTDLMWKMQNDAKYIFLSRPRRFGKSLLSSTLEAFFRGERELFNGLKIMPLEQHWEKYPVLHIDMNAGEYTSRKALEEKLDYVLTTIERQYGLQKENDGAGMRFESIIKSVFKLMGKQVVILVDEYEKPLLETIDNPALFEQFQIILHSFYSTLKSCDAYIRFAFLTGITRFGKLSVFSGLNNLKDISMSEDFSAICGFTEEEVRVGMHQAVQDLADYNNMTATEANDKLKSLYDGYRFSRRSQGVYNPFSVLSNFSDKEFRNYWYVTGTPTFLIRLLQHEQYDLSLLQGQVASTEERLGNIGTAGKENVIAALYQSGYLTLKGYDAESRMYSLGFPNKEVEEGFLNSLLPYYSGISDAKVDQLMFELRKLLDNGDANGLMLRLKSVFAGIPFENTRYIELNYRNMVFLVFTLLGAHPLVEHPVSSGRIDLLLERPRHVYIFEFKVGKPPEEALEQIDQKHYADMFATDKRPLLKVGVTFNNAIKNIDAWEVVETNNKPKH